MLGVDGFWRPLAAERHLPAHADVFPSFGRNPPVGFMIRAPRHEGETLRQRICRSDIVPRRSAVAWFLNPGQGVARWAFPATRRLHPVRPWSPC
jgi:hypothetical protein